MSDWEEIPLAKKNDDWEEVDNSTIEKAGEKPWYSMSPDGLWEGVKRMPETLDSVTGAPVRKFLTEAVTGKTLDKAPSGRDQAKMMGFTDAPYIGRDIWGVPEAVEKISPADVMGLNLEVVQDPLLALGAGAKGIKKGASWAAKTAGEKLKWLAEKSALNATGATGSQAAKFADDAGRQLLDRKIVRFGDSQEKIAERAGKAVEGAESNIDTALTGLDKQGAKVDANDIYNSISNKIKELKSDPSQADIVAGLERERDNLLSATDARGSTDFSLTDAEKIKRGYNRKAGNWADPEKSQVGKEMYHNFRGGVEQAAEAADPALASTFKEGKESYGLLAPIQEAAERRAMTQSQSPLGGVKDIAAFVAGGPAGPILNRIGAPRVSSSIAAGSDAISKMLLKSPKMQHLAQTNPPAFKAMVASIAARTSKPSEQLSKVAGPNEKPVSEQEAQSAFVEGN